MSQSTTDSDEGASSNSTKTTASTSASPSTASQANKICLNFSHTKYESTSKRIKCKTFWQYVASRPDLQALKASGWTDPDRMLQKSCGTQTPAFSERRPWTKQLLAMKEMGLDRAALNFPPPPASSPPDDSRIWADTVEEAPEVTLAALDAYTEAAVHRLQGRRYPEQVYLQTPTPHVRRAARDRSSDPCSEEE